MMSAVRARHRPPGSLVRGCWPKSRQGAHVSGDEVLVTWASIFAGLWLAWIYYRRIAKFWTFNASERQYVALAAAPLVALLGVFAVIKTAGSGDVRDAPEYLLMYSVLGLVWFMGAAFIMDL